MPADAKKRIESIVDTLGVKKIGVAVSGGSDSMCLLHFCHAVLIQQNGKKVLSHCEGAKRLRQSAVENTHSEQKQHFFLKRIASPAALNDDKLGFSMVCRPPELIAVNIDHSTRGGDSADDSLFVAEFCKKHDIPLSAHVVDAPKFAKENKLNFEAAARMLRYEIFDKLIKDGTVDVIFTAHHALDQAETILLHALRGCGSGGIIGIREHPERNIFRPLIMTSKAEIEEYLASHKVPYITDKSNFDTTNDRNFLRHKIIPLLEERFNGCTERLGYLAAALKDDEDFINSFLSQANTPLSNGVTSLENRGIVESDANTILSKGVAPLGDGVFLPLNIFDKPRALISRHILTVLNSRDIGRQNIEDIIQLAKNGQNGDRISLPNGITAWREYDKIVFVPSVTASEANQYKKNSLHWIASSAALPRNDGWGSAKGKYFDLDFLPKTAVIRTRKDGDILHKFDGTTVKLKKYFIDKKIPQRLRDGIPLICDGNRVLLIAGYEVSKELAVGQNSKKIGELCCTLSPHR